MTDIKNVLADFKKEADREIALFLDKAIEESFKKDKLIGESLEYVKKLALSGGKRLRPAFMYYGYIAGGGKEREKMLRTSVSVELIHIFLLIHDDIIDRDSKRHGVETVNFRYSRLGKKMFKIPNASHFGDSMAIIVGDMVGALGNQIIFNSGFSAELVMQALFKLQSIISLTVIGQSKDLYMGYKKEASQEEILKMYEYKTAKYTFEGPLHLGLILGNGKEDLLRALSDYAIPLGIAFQIQDDILGIFGSESKIGKSVGSDIKEGKQTLILAKARELANAKERRKIEQILNKKEISNQDVEEFRKIIIETGSLDWSSKLAQKYVQEGMAALSEIKIEKEAKNFLAGVSEYMVKREI